MSAPASAAMLTRAMASFNPSKRQVSVRAMTTKSGSDRSRCLHAKADLVGELLARHGVRDVLVVVRALGIELVLDMRAGDAGADALAHGAHGVQRLAEARAAVDHQRDVDRRRHVARHAQLLVHGEQRLGGAARGAGDEAAGVHAVEAEALQQASAERIVGDRQVDELLLLQQAAQRGGFLHALYSRDATERRIRRHRRRRRQCRAVRRDLREGAGRGKGAGAGEGADRGARRQLAVHRRRLPLRARRARRSAPRHPGRPVRGRGGPDRAAGREPAGIPRRPAARDRGPDRRHAVRAARRPLARHDELDAPPPRALPPDVRPAVLQGRGQAPLLRRGEHRSGRRRLGPGRPAHQAGRAPRRRDPLRHRPAAAAAGPRGHGHRRARHGARRLCGHPRPQRGARLRRLRGERRDARAHSGRAGSMRRCAGRSSTPARACAMALESGRRPYGDWGSCHAVAWDLNAPPFGNRRGAATTSRSTRTHRHHRQRGRRAVRRRGRRLPQPHLRQVRARDPQAAAPRRVPDLRREESSTAARRVPHRAGDEGRGADARRAGGQARHRPRGPRAHGARVQRRLPAGRIRPGAPRRRSGPRASSRRSRTGRCRSIRRRSPATP